MREFIGPLPATLHRGYEGMVELHYRYRTAEEFVLAVADFLKTQGREAEIERETWKYGDVVRVVSTPTRRSDALVMVSASRGAGGGRWRFNQATAFPLLGGQQEARTYGKAKTLVEVYGS